MDNKHVRLSIEKRWVLEDVARRPPSYYGGASVLIKYNTRNHILLPLFVEWKQASLRVKWGIVLDESKLHFGRNPSESHLTPTVARVHNGRHEHEHRPFSMLITVDVRWLSDGFRPIFWWILPDFLMGFALLFNGFYPIITFVFASISMVYKRDSHISLSVVSCFALLLKRKPPWCNASFSATL